MPYLARELGRGAGDFSASLCLYFPLLLDKNITYWEIPHVRKKVSLVPFRQVLTKILAAACIQLHNYDLFEKARKIMSLNIKQCPAELSPRIIC